MCANTGATARRSTSIYVVDERGKLIDDLRIREFLLRPLTTKVSDIMRSELRRI